MKDVTIVIPNYNGERFLAQCLDSIRPEKQKSEVSYRILVVDNGSRDESADILRARADWVDAIYLEENCGFCKAVNLGIGESDTPYVLLLNNDTRAFPGFVQALYDTISKREKCFSVSASMRMWDDPDRLDDAGDLYCALGWSRARGKGENAAKYARTARVFSSCAGAAIYRRSVFAEIGTFDEDHFMYLEDLDICYRALIHGYYSLYEPRARVLHYGSASTGSRYNEKKVLFSAANNIYVIYKNMPVLQILLNLPLLLAGFGIKTVFFLKKGLGSAYLKGLAGGFRKSLKASRLGKGKKVPFRAGNLPAYLWIQALLWANCFRISLK
ncbi:MAG: glycosyltransferase family 2 protein [Lachnospiraceae bacterium]|nr:glycosyltransferase family 2 protein [Lachnospiraceae bacterium]